MMVALAVNDPACVRFRTALAAKDGINTALAVREPEIVLNRAESADSDPLVVFFRIALAVRLPERPIRRVASSVNEED